MLFSFLRHATQPLDITKLMAEYKMDLDYFISLLKEHMDNALLVRLANIADNFMEEGVPEKLAWRIAFLPRLVTACVLHKISITQKIPFDKIAPLYFSLNQRFDFEWLVNEFESLHSANYWERLSVTSLKEQLSDLHMLLTAKVAAKAKEDNYHADSLLDWCVEHRKQVERCDNFIQDLKSQDAINLPMMVIAMRRIELLFML
jgi:glutamate dehydrogenase